LLWAERIIGSMNFARLAAALGASLGTTVEPRARERVRGGSINMCYRFECGHGSLFVKVARPDALAMLEAEAAGLEELRAAHAVRVPRVLASGTVPEASYLALEWLVLVEPSSTAATRLGEQLAHQHRVRSASFGWERSNTIGATPQDNRPAGDWPTFFRERRLGYQLELARRNGYRHGLEGPGAELLGRVSEFFFGYAPIPSLLHGDLWAGNWAASAHDEPVLFDPAVYYGDRETDLAMTQLFGGFAPSFYTAYESAWPLAPGAEVRCALYNLYHVLNHLNLFGGEGYLRQAQALIDRLLAEMR
jgi:protein-ribulosamine 3-kinase